jgi:hypothetical protein
VFWRPAISCSRAPPRSPCRASACLDLGAPIFGAVFRLRTGAYPGSVESPGNTAWGTRLLNSASRTPFSTAVSSSGENAGSLRLDDQRFELNGEFYRVTAGLQVDDC